MPANLALGKVNFLKPIYLTHLFKFLKPLIRLTGFEFKQVVDVIGWLNGLKDVIVS